MTAGKGLDERLCEVRIRYKQKTHNKLVTAMSGRKVSSNELVMRIQVWTGRRFALYCACVLSTAPAWLTGCSLSLTPHFSQPDEPLHDVYE